MSSMREKDQADFDLERFVNMFDEAMTSQDPRVVNALRSLMMIVTLTKPESNDLGLHDRNHGPLRRLYDDVGHLNRRLGRLEEEHHYLQRQLLKEVEAESYKYPNEKYAAMKAGRQVESIIDPSVLNQIKARAKGLYDK